MYKKLTLLLTLFPLLSFSGTFKTGNPVRERSSKEAMTESIHKKFEKFQEMIAEEKYTEAKSGLTALTAKRLNGFEKASIEQFLGWAESLLDNHDAAARHLQNAIDADALPNRAQFSMMLQLSQMHAGAGKYKKSISALEKYYKVTDEVKDSTFNYEASIYTQLANYRKALKAINKAIELEDKPHERWHNLRFNLYMLMSDFKNAATEIEFLIKLNPSKKEYWKKLNQVYFTLKKDKKALAALILADKNGMLTDEKERMQLYKMYAYLGVPYKAGKVLEKGLKSGLIKPSYKKWDDLGSVWYSAAEMDKALEAFDQASKLASDGKIDLRRAFIYYDKQNWNKAISALNSAVEKGGIKDTKIGNAYLLLGMANNELGKTNSAIVALKKAMNYKKSRKNAVDMIEYLQAERKRKAKIREQEKMFAEQEQEIEES